MRTFTFQEFKPTIFFLLRFLGIYVVGNLLYGFFITRYYPGPDPVTSWVSHQSAVVVSAMGWKVHVVEMLARPTAFLKYGDDPVISIYEGCNGLNVMIIFVAFIAGFGPATKKMAWFVPFGLIVIHAANLVRIILLFFVTLYLPDFLYFAHKYLFTAFLYLIVFLLWIWWVRKIARHE
jgi:exosortase family protein XrtF